ncbi:MAG: MoxR family ATPase [Candidatus Aenigmarchaeota archaeon]|nr:MoxR family ATPase [Candidatus Aenigmarchaeota archaeon]
MDLKESIKEESKRLEKLKKEIQKGIIGQESVIDSVIKCLMCNGHVLLEGVPGLAKTLLVMLLAKAVSGTVFKRIQFTPDLLPSDITGTTMYIEKEGIFRAQKGPIFANFVLGDEINRTTPKVQSAMLQAMQERQVTIGMDTFDLPKPFIVLATENPLEQAGTYPLAVAQTDRFLFKVYVDYPTEEEELRIIDVNSVVKSLDEYGIKEALGPQDIERVQNTVRQIKITEKVKDYILNIVEATRYPEKYGLEFHKFIDYGGSPRASIFLSLAGKANAMMEGRDYATPDDIRKIALNVLRHRIILNYEGKARNISTDDIIRDIINKVPVV